MTRLTQSLALLLLLATLACGAAKSADDTPAVEEAAKAYLAQKISVENVDVTVTEVKIEGEKAECQVAINPKSTPDMKMSYAYKLEKKAGKWAVTSSSGSSHAMPTEGMPGGMHGGMEGGMPPGHPAVGEANAPAADPHGMPSHAPAGEASPGSAPAPSNAPAK